MNYKSISTLFFAALVLTLLLSFGNGQAVNWWESLGDPKYGGDIKLAVQSTDPSFDAAKVQGLVQYGYWLDSMFMPDWKLDRNKWAFKVFNVPELYYWQGMLVESWEWPDIQTAVLHVRKGVHWQDKAPVNGREFTAKDLEYHLHRIFGVGSGFTEPSASYAGMLGDIKNITATDKYTVTIQYNNSSFLSKYRLMEAPIRIQARESVETNGGLSDWELAAGTGPWILSNYVSGSSLSFDKNTNYWGVDERHPENRIPYADNVTLVCIPDSATQLAAIRTGKVDFLTGIAWNQAKTLAETNPDLVQSELPRNGMFLQMRVDTKPFNNIKVRKAMQMAINTHEIAEHYYNGLVDGTPRGLLSPVNHAGWCRPFAEWPKELQDEYTYNPDKAKELLKEAGYPDGIETHVITSPRFDTALLEVVKSYLMNIGVDMEIKVFEHAALQNMAVTGKSDQMCIDLFSHGALAPWKHLGMHDSEPKSSTDTTQNNDSTYSGMMKNLDAITHVDELRQTVIEADMYDLKKHWAIFISPGLVYNISQPYLKGYSGEECYEYFNFYFSRMWIDKK